MPNRDVIIEKSMEEILQKVQREFAEEGRQEVQARPAPLPRSAEVFDINAAVGREARSSATAEILESVSGNGAGVALARLAAIYGERRRASESSMGNTASTLEDVVREMLRPMLQDWLDQKLLEIIERLVKAELSRAIGELPRFAS
jgi:cell pole-organizing protein PopZ